MASTRTWVGYFVKNSRFSRARAHKLTKIKRNRFGIANFVSYFVELLVKSFDLTANFALSESQNSLILNLFQPPSC